MHFGHGARRAFAFIEPRRDVYKAATSDVPFVVDVALLAFVETGPANRRPLSTACAPLGLSAKLR